MVLIFFQVRTKSYLQICFRTFRTQYTFSESPSELKDCHVADLHDGKFEVLSRSPILVARRADLLAVIITRTSNVAIHALADITTDTQEIKHTHFSKNTGLFCTRFTITVISVPYRKQTTTLN